MLTFFDTYILYIHTCVCCVPTCTLRWSVMFDTEAPGGPVEREGAEGGRV